MVPYLFVYDIPSNADVDNPSKQLRRLGFRINKSCWVILEEDIPYPLIAELVDNGASCHTFRFDVREAGALRELAARELKRELSASLATARRKASEASIEYTNGMGDPAELAARHRAECRRLISTYRDMLDSLGEAAKRFGVSEHIGRSEAENAFRTMRQTLATTARNYMLDLAKVEKMCGKDALPVAVAAAGNPLPPGMLRDWILDEGI